MKIKFDVFDVAAPKEFNLPKDHSVSKLDDKIIINEISPAQEKESKNL